MVIYTAQIAQWRKVTSRGVELIDTTVKSGEPAFAPTWQMVMDVKSGALSEVEYRRQYIDLMRESFHAHRAVWEDLMAKENIALGCYCNAGTFCHRYILQEMVLWLANQRGILATSGGEIS